MKKVFLHLSLFCALAFAASCDKEKDDAVKITKEAIAGKYVLTQVVAQPGPAERDITEFFLEDCELDDVIEFKTDLTYEVTEGQVQCADPTHEVGPWSLPGNKRISIDGDEADITKWDGRELHLSRLDEVNGQMVLIVFKLRKQ